MSRTVDILNKIKASETYSPLELSRAEEILKAICNSAAVDLVQQSRYEELLLCLKNSTETTLQPKTRLEELLVAIINGTLDTWLAGKNIFDNSTFRQGGWGYESPIRIHSNMNTRIDKTKNYVLSTNLDLSVYEYGINGSNIDGKTGTLLYDSGWKRTNTLLLEANKYGGADIKYLGIVVKRIDSGNITPADIQNVKFQIQIGTSPTKKNYFDESKWGSKEIIDNKNCLVFNGFYATDTGNKVGNPLLIASNLPVGTYTVKGKFKKTTHFNALAGLNENNERTAFGTFKDNFTSDTITFTTTEKLKYLYIDTGSATANGYCEVETLRFETGEIVYNPYCFLSELETEFYKAFGVE